MKHDKTKIISAKDLGQLAMPNFCPQCFWLQRHFGKPPSIFPGIFSTLDAITKRSTHASFSQTNLPPDWLKAPEAVDVVEGNTYFNLPVEQDWILVGQPDDIFKLKDNTYQIIDYKTARFTGQQDELLPMYEVQLNAYAYLAEKYGFQPVSKLALVYFQPEQDLDPETFKLKFDTYQLEIELQADLIPSLLAQARQVVLAEKMPEGKADCKGICNWVKKIN